MPVKIDAFGKKPQREQRRFSGPVSCFGAFQWRDRAEQEPGGDDNSLPRGDAAVKPTARGSLGGGHSAVDGASRMSPWRGTLAIVPAAPLGQAGSETTGKKSFRPGAAEACDCGAWPPRTGHKGGPVQKAVRQVCGGPEPCPCPVGVRTHKETTRRRFDPRSQSLGESLKTSPRRAPDTS